MDYKHATDMELLLCCKNDDIRAYNELVDRFAPRLHKIGLRYLHDGFVVEELAMDLLFNIWERRMDISIDHSLSAYLFRAYRNMIARQLCKKIPVTSPIEAVTEHEFPPSSRTADDDLIFAQTALIYQENLARLSPQRRMVFRLSREENLSYKAIAERTGLSLNTVENYMAAALACLRRFFGKHTLHIWLTMLLTVQP